MTLDKIKPEDAIRFAKLEGSDVTFVEPFLKAAVSFVRSYTGIPRVEESRFPELAIAALIVFTDMYDNRAMSVEQAAENRTVKAILDMHSYNLLPGGDADV